MRLQGKRKGGGGANCKYSDPSSLECVSKNRGGGGKSLRAPL